MVRALRDNGIASGRRREPWFAGGNGRLADQTFAPVKVGFLFADMNNDPGRPGCVFVIPPTDLSGAREGTLWKSLATANEHGNQTCACNADKTARIHKGGYLSRLVRPLQLKLWSPCSGGNSPMYFAIRDPV